MAGADRREGRPVHGGNVASWLRKVFELSPAGPNWPRAVLFLDVALVPLVVFWAIGYKQYLYRVLWTLCRVAIGVVVMLLAGLLARRTTKAPPQRVPQPA